MALLSYQHQSQDLDVADSQLMFPIECLWDKRQGAARELVIKKLRGQWKLPLKIKMKDLNLLRPLLPFPRLRNSLCVAP